MSTTQGIKLDDETIIRLKTVAEQKGRSPHWLMKTAIERYLADEELYEREKIEDLARFELYVLTGTAYETSEVEPWIQKLVAGNNTAWHE
jgi:predicted transcriptional regulator